MPNVLTAPDLTNLTYTDLARMNKLDGLHLAGLVRKSSKEEWERIAAQEAKQKASGDGNATTGTKNNGSDDTASGNEASGATGTPANRIPAPYLPYSGLDINNRDEQEKSCRRYTEVRGGIYVYTYDEPHTSAWKKKRIKVIGDDGSVSYIYRVIRPVFEGALEDLKRGRTPDGQQLDGLIVHDIDRLTRDGRHLEDAIEVVQFFNRPVLDIRGSLDLLTDNGRAAARMMVTMANKQSADTSRRLVDSHAARAAFGIPCGGHRPFGWQEDKRTLEPHEAALLLDAVKDIFAGIHTKTIVARWNKAGITTARGCKWDDRTLRKILLSPRLCGWRTYQARGKNLWESYMTDYRTGKPVKGQHEPIIDEEQWAKLVAILTNVKKREGYTGGIKYLCSKYVRCSGCGGPMLGSGDSHTKLVYYACKDPDCKNRVSVTARVVDELVTAYVLAYLGNQQVTPDVKPWPKADELTTAEAKATELLDAYDRGDLPGDLAFPRIKNTKEKIAGLKRERTAYFRGQSKAAATTDVAARWPRLALEQQREIIGECIEAIVVKKAPSLGNKFNYERVEIIAKA